MKDTNCHLSTLTMFCRLESQSVEIKTLNNTATDKEPGALHKICAVQAYTTYVAIRDND